MPEKPPENKNWFLLKRQLEHGALPHACLFYGDNEEEKESAVSYLMEHILGKNFKTSQDFYEVNKESISISDARDAKSWACLTALTGERKALLIRNIELLSRDAAPVMLKLLEEPALGTFFLATTADIKKVLPTVRSRFISVRFWSGKAQTQFAEIKKLAGLSYAARFPRVKSILDKEIFDDLLREALGFASLGLRRKISPNEIARLERLLKIKAALYDPTINKRLLCEYFMMVL